MSGYMNGYIDKGICPFFTLELYYSHIIDNEAELEKFSGLLEAMQLRA